MATAVDSKATRPQKIIVQSIATASTPFKPAAFNGVKVKSEKVTTFRPKAAAVNPVNPPPKTTATTTTSTTTSATSTSTATTTSTKVQPKIVAPTSEKPSEKFSSHYNADRPPFHAAPPPPLRPNVKDLLATIGLTAEVFPTTTTTEHPPELTPELRELLNSFGLLTNEQHPLHPQYAPELIQEDFLPIPSYNFNHDDTFHVDEYEPAPPPPPYPTVSSVTKHYRMNTAPEVVADDFSAFKPLPIPEDQVITDDMEEFFKAYGLLDGAYRHKKSMIDRSGGGVTTTPSKPVEIMERMPAVKVDFLSDTLKGVLGSMGIERVTEKPSTMPETIVTDEVETSRPSVQQAPTVSLPRARPTKPEIVEIDVETSRPSVQQEPTVSLPRARPTKPEIIGSETDSSRPSVPSTAPTTDVTLPRARPTYPEVIMKIRLPDVKATDRSDASSDDVDDDAPNENEQDYKKLRNLLDTIKRLDKLNKTLTDSDINSLDLANFNLSTTLLRQFNAASAAIDDEGPNPVDNIDGGDVQKNEIKRQSAEEKTESQSPFKFTLDLAATTEEGQLDKDLPITTPTVAVMIVTPTVTKTTTTTTTSTTTSTPKKPTLLTSEERKSDLGDSFAGGLDPVTEEPLPPPRRNGFYFLADWNSFLEVGEDPDKVVVRFDPKIGDPSRFIPVTVP